MTPAKEASRETLNIAEAGRKSCGLQSVDHFAWELLLGLFRLGRFAWKFVFENFRLKMFVWGFFAWEFHLGTFAWELSHVYNSS